MSLLRHSRHHVAWRTILLPARDAANFARLRRQGWKVLRIWEHELERDLARQVERILDTVASRRRG